MVRLTRRGMLTALAGLAAMFSGWRGAAAATVRRSFVEQAFAMKRQAIESGDQPFGAVVVRADEIVGFGPSRVVLKNDNSAHAEREAIRDAQMRLRRTDLSDCVMYSTSPPCAACQQAAAEARLARMYAGSDGADLGAPRRSP